jgi:hypothetical protein
MQLAAVMAVVAAVVVVEVEVQVDPVSWQAAYAPIMLEEADLP